MAVFTSSETNRMFMFYGEAFGNAASAKWFFNPLVKLEVLKINSIAIGFDRK